MRSLLLPALASAIWLSKCASATPCGDMAVAQANSLNTISNAGSALIDASIAYQCITDIPFQKDYSTKLVTSLKAWLELESQLDYLKDPPSGYLWNSIDIPEELNRISSDVQSSKYKTQYDFEVDLSTLFLYFHDFHSLYRGRLATQVSWLRQFHLVSASMDGKEMPKVYVMDDLLFVSSDTSLVSSGISEKDISAVKSINDIPVQEFLQTQQLVADSHDPDAMYNRLFLSIWQSTNPAGSSPDTFRSPYFYPGADTVIKFENGSSVSPTNLASTSCSIGDITTGQEYWDTCVTGSLFADSTSTETSTKRSVVERPRAVETGAPAVSQIPSHPLPHVIDQAGLLSGYYIDATGYDHVAVLVIRGFASSTVEYTASYQDSLETFLKDAVADGKTNLIIDIQGNGGGYTDLGAELLAQLFPNVPPDQKGNFRAAPGLEVVLERQSALVAAENTADKNDAEDVLINESQNPYAWQSMMTPDATEFTSFDEYWGPKEISNNGKYTSFFQPNYTNTDPTDLNSISIQITGYGNRVVPSGTKPPFAAENIVMLSDGFCGSTCSIAFELLTNIHSIPTIVAGGRPVTGPMQSVGNTKGSQVFTDSLLSYFITQFYNDTTPAADRTPAKGTPFADWDDFALSEGLIQLQARNNYRIGDPTETVLQMVYTAADCKMWYTPDMLVDPVAVWKRTADIAFDSKRKTLGAGGGAYTNEYCVKDSTGHASSVTGGLKQGKLGEQNPPDNAYPQYLGWLKDGKDIVQGFSLVTSSAPAGSDGKSATNSDDDEPLTETELRAGLAQLKEVCSGYKGDKWLFSLICGVLG